MFEFVSLVVLANLILLACLYFLRRVIDVRVPVLFMAVGISVFFCILYPFLATLVSYPQIIYLYAVLILAGAGLLYLIESKLASGEIRENEYAGVSVGDALAVVEGGGPAVEVNSSVFHDYGTSFPGTPDTEKPVEVIAGAELQPEAIVEEKSAVEAAAEEEPVEMDAAVELVEETVAATVLEEIVPAGPDEQPDVLAAPDMDLADEDVETEAEAVEPAGYFAGEFQYTEIEAEEFPSCEPEPAAAAGEPAVEGPYYGSGGDEQDISGIVARAFDILVAGDKIGAAETFFKALKLNPPPKLAAMLCIEISSIYLSAGSKRQALAVMEMVEDVWGSILDEKDSARVKTIKNQLRREIE
ncbi:MAG: hypothetical protein ACOY40_16065 [Bacillota bacterium]